MPRSHAPVVRPLAARPLAVRLLAARVIAGLVLSLASCGASQPKQPTSARAAIGPDSSPAQVADAYIAGIEAYLASGRGESDRDKDLLTWLGELVSDQTIVEPLKTLGIDLSGKHPRTIALLKESTTLSWATLINFYRGHIEHPAFATVPATQTAPAVAPGHSARIVMPVRLDDRALHPVDLVVTCIRENNRWRIRLVTLEPRE